MGCGLAAQRARAPREFALGLAALDRFVRGEPLSKRFRAKMRDGLQRVSR